MAAYLVLLHLAIAQSHGEVGIAVVGHVFLHAQLGGTEILLLLIDAAVQQGHVGLDVGQYLGDTQAILHAGIMAVALAVDVNSLVAFHQLRVLVEMVYKPLEVAAVVVVDEIEEVWMVFDLHLLAVVLQQRSQNLAVGVAVPGVVGVLELNVLLLWLLLRPVDDDAACMYARSTTRQLVGVAAPEGLVVDGEGARCLEPLLIEPLQEAKVELAAVQARRVHPLPKTSLVLRLLADEAYAVNALIHADGVLPVVG